MAIAVLPTDRFLIQIYQSAFSDYFLAQFVASPVRIRNPCSSAGIIYSRLSLTAFGLPGRFTISVPFRIPAAARLSIALGVIVILYALIASGIPGTSRSIISFVASGIQSLGENPVPPVVTISSAIPSSASHEPSHLPASFCHPAKEWYAPLRNRSLQNFLDYRSTFIFSLSCISRITRCNNRSFHNSLSSYLGH